MFDPPLEQLGRLDVAEHAPRIPRALVGTALRRLLTMRLATWPVCAPTAEHVCDEPHAAIADAARRVLQWRCSAPPVALRRRRQPVATATRVDARTSDGA